MQQLLVAVPLRTLQGLARPLGLHHVLNPGRCVKPNFTIKTRVNAIFFLREGSTPSGFRFCLHSMSMAVRIKILQIHWLSCVELALAIAVVCSCVCAKPI